MKRILNISNIYIFLWCFYSLQGIIYPIGGIISRTSLATIILLSLFYFVYLNLQKGQMPFILRSLSWFIFLLSIYGIAYILFGENNTLNTPKFTYLKSIYMSLLPIYPFYSFIRDGYLNEEKLKKWIPVFFLTAVACFYSDTLTNNNQYANTSLEYSSDYTNNAGYIMLSLIPLTLLYRKKPIIQYGFLLLIITFIILGMKRGAILIGAICTIWIICTSYSYATRKEKFWIIFGTILIIILGIFYITYLWETNDYFNKRFEQTESGDMSDRDILYYTLFHHLINDASITHLVFGAGADATVRIANNYAHNDWLEIAVNNGFIGIISYTIYWFSLLIVCRNAKPYVLHYQILTSFLIISFMQTLFSMSYNSLTIFLTSIFAWALATMPSNTSYKYGE